MNRDLGVWTYEDFAPVVIDDLPRRPAGLVPPGGGRCLRMNGLGYAGDGDSYLVTASNGRL